jgi:hypothetical protein
MDRLLIVSYSLAHLEMKNIIARLLWNFDMELQSDSMQWADSQRSYVLWDKPDLNAKLTVRERI